MKDRAQAQVGAKHISITRAFFHDPGDVTYHPHQVLMNAIRIDIGHHILVIEKDQVDIR